MSIKTYITKIHYEKVSKSLLIPFLDFIAFFYEIITKLRNYMYDKDILKSEKISTYVISVGNLTTGGVGKTPVVAEIAKYFVNQNKRVAIISRGYGGKLSNKEPRFVSINGQIMHNAQEVGDEPYWFAENIPQASVLTCSNRIKAANKAIRHVKPDVIILDDAFQHRKIKRDLDILLVDSEKIFGNGKHLPAGPLRENLNGLKRADKLVIMNKSGDEIKNMDFFENIFEKDKISICNILPSYTYNIKTTEILPLKTDVTAICAIGQPEQFYNFVRQKFNLLNMITFDDHHQYKKEDVENIKGSIVTTEKDAVKLAFFDFDNIYALKLKLDLDVEGLLECQQLIK